jgi:signal transduction histidine kinase
MNIGAHGSAQMRPRARLIGLLGEELISDEPVALVELVKNAYDADATFVRIRFEGSGDQPERIIIQDDGIGMSLDTVLYSWFEPGTVSKKRESRSPRGRSYQGAKGIGRFASARLGDTLLMETQSLGNPGVSVFISWGRFSDDEYLDSVSLDYSTGSISGLSQGTRLTVEGLKTGIWDEESYRKLHARLSRLISPFGEVSDFQVELQIPGYPQFSGIVDPPLALNEPKYLMKGSMSREGRLFADIYVDGELQKKVEDLQLMPRGEVPACGGFAFEVRAWDRDREGLEPIAAKFDTSVGLLRQVLNTYSGVSIYRDGFRVYPYGEAGNDWLQLDSRSRQKPGQHLANNQVVAAIQISRDENSELKDRSAREGMIRNAAHDALEGWFKAALQQLEEVRYKVRPRQEQKKQDSLFEAFDLSAAIAKLRAELGSDSPAVKLLEETEKQVSEGIDRIQDVFSRLLLSAGLGHMVDVVIHEIGAPLGKINRQVEILQRDVAKIAGSPLPDKLDKSFSSIRTWSEHIFNLRQRLEPHTAGRRGKATSFSVKEEVELTLSLYEALLTRQKMNCVVEQPDGAITARMSSASFGQVIANLIDNAIYWTAFKHGVGQGGKLLIRLRKLEHGFSVAVHDNGPGVSEEDEDRIFDSYYSKKPNGMGLGLYIARLVIEPYGRVIYQGESELGGACFEALFEQGVGL